MEQTLGEIIECSYLRHHLNLIKDSTNDMILGSEDVFAHMRDYDYLLVNSMFAETGFFRNLLLGFLKVGK